MLLAFLTSSTCSIKTGGLECEGAILLAVSLCVCWFAETDDVLVSSGEVSVGGSSQQNEEEEEEENGGRGKRGRKRKRETNPSELLKGAKYVT